MRIPLLASAVAASLAVSGCGLGGPAYKAPPAAVDAVVDMTIGFNYSPNQLTIVEGQTVEWRNKSIMGHTVTADPSKAKNAADVMLPAGAQPFHSGNIGPGEVWQYRFTVPGDYRYFCIPHEGQGMVGTVRVTRRG